MELCGKGSRLGEGRASHGAFTSGRRKERVTGDRQEGNCPSGSGHSVPQQTSEKLFLFLKGFLLLGRLRGREPFPTGFSW